MSTADERAARDAAIMRELRAKVPIAKLSLKYRLTGARIRQIAEREKKRRARKRTNSYR